jgi:hypothetical protein
MHHIKVTNLTLFHFHNQFIVLIIYMFQASSVHLQETLHWQILCELRSVVAVVGRLVYWALSSVHLYSIRGYIASKLMSLYLVLLFKTT